MGRRLSWGWGRGLEKEGGGKVEGERAWRQRRMRRPELACGMGLRYLNPVLLFEIVLQVGQ